MAGLLENMMNDDGARLGLSLLAAAGPSQVPMNAFQRIDGAFNSATTLKNSQEDRALKKRFTDSQIAENESQDQVRRLKLAQDARQQEIDAQFYGMPAPASGLLANGSQPAPQSQGLLGAGATAGGVAAPQTQQPASNAPLGGMTAAQISQKFGIPLEAVISDYKFNGGKKIAELIDSRTKPNWVTNNGYTQNTNAPGFAGGFAPQLNISPDNRASMVTIGPGGKPQVSVPDGALDAFKLYANAGEAAKAGYDPTTNVLPGGRTIKSTRLADVNEVNGASAPMVPPQPGVTGSFVGDPARVAMSIAAIKDPQERANAQAALDQQMGKVAPAAANRPGFELQGSAEKNFSDQVANLSAKDLLESRDKAKTASDALITIQESRKAIDSGTYGGSLAEQKLGAVKLAAAIGINLDPLKATNTDYLKSTLGQGLLDKAKTLGANPSNADASRITDIVGSIGKDPQAMKKILDWQEEMAKRTITGHNGMVDQSEKSGLKSPYDLRVALPESKSAAKDAPKATMRYNPQTKKLEKVD